MFRFKVSTAARIYYPIHGEDCLTSTDLKRISCPSP